MIWNELLTSPTSAYADVGPWLTGFFVVMAGVWLVRQVWLSFFPLQIPPPIITIPSPGSEYVTKRELDMALTALKNDIITSQTHLMDRFDDLRQQSRDLREYTSRISHEMRNELQNINISMAQISTAMNCEFVKRPRPNKDTMSPVMGMDIPSMKKEKGRDDL